MRRWLLLLCVLLFSAPSFAQVKIINVQTQVDTLIYTAVDMETLYLFKGPQGYLIKAESTNMFDSTPRFYLGKDKETCIESLQDLISLTENDVATQIVVQDAEGNLYMGITAQMALAIRKPIPAKSDRIVMRNSEMSGSISLKRKAMENLIKYLNQ